MKMNVLVQKYIEMWLFVERKRQQRQMSREVSIDKSSGAKAQELRQKQRDQWYQCFSYPNKKAKTESIASFEKHQLDFLRKFSATQDKTTNFPNKQAASTIPQQPQPIVVVTKPKRTRAPQSQYKATTIYSSSIDIFKKKPYIKPTKSTSYDLQSSKLQLLIMNENVKFDKKPLPQKRKKLTRHTKSSIIRPISLIQPIIDLS